MDKDKGRKNVVKSKPNNKIVNIARGVISSVAVVLIIVGYFDGGAADILQKAINICTECIGLG